MASLDNFHTGNGGKMRRDLYPDTRQRMQAIQMGLVSNTQWDLGNQVPVQRDQYRAKDTVSINHVTPRYTERLDANIKDLLVPTVPYTRRMRGSTADSVLLYDRSHASSIRGVLGGWVQPLIPLNQNSQRVRYTPY